MDRSVRHFSLHRLEGTELRVISDVDAGVIPIVRAEEEVIRGYSARAAWPHRWVTLFILRDLQPLVRLVPEGAGLPPGDTAALDHRPVVSVYDLADLTACHVFVNQQAMAKEGYWDDCLAVRGLLAHEHAHPLSENDATRASRSLEVELSWRMREPVALGVASRGEGLDAPSSGRLTPAPELAPASEMAEVKVVGAPWESRLDRLLAVLVDKLCVYAPREIFANEVAIRCGFEEALLHLNRLNVAGAVRSVEGRESLRRHLEEEVVGRKALLPPGAGVLLLVGDLKGYLDMALEVAPFYRAGRAAEALELEAGLQAAVFSRLEPEVARAYEALRDRYIALRADASPTELATWTGGVAEVLAGTLQARGLALRYQVTAAH